MYLFQMLYTMTCDENKQVCFKRICDDKLFSPQDFEKIKCSKLNGASKDTNVCHRAMGVSCPVHSEEISMF